uniref:SPATA31 subfamily G member 1 n=1 Tax=Moschus moschiferus TaxID=68415 RepID=A0A8C6DRY1_MOSMO
MEWLPEDLRGSEGVLGLLWNQLTYALACRHCGSSCLQSPGNLITLFLFMVWQIQRWWQLGRWRQLQPWYSGNKMRGKGLPLLYHVAFLDCLWKQKSEEEEEAFLDPLKTCSLPKEAPIGEQVTTAPSQPSCNSEGLHKAAGTLEQGLMQTPNPPRCFPTFQILTNLPVRHTTASGSRPQERKSQFFWGLPSLHSESLEAVFLSSGGLSPLKLSVSPSVFFNKLAFLPGSPVLLLPRYCFPTPLPTQEAHTTEDLERMASDPQQSPSPSSPPVPSLPLHLNPFPMDHKRVLSDTELFYSSEAWWKEDPKIPEPAMPATSLTQASLPECQGVSPLGGPSGSEALWETMRQREKPQIPEPEISVPCQSVAPLIEPQGTSTLGVPPADKTQWGTTGHKESTQAFQPPMPALCQPSDPLSEAQEVSPEGGPSATKDFWGSLGHRVNPMASGSPVSPPAFDLDPGLHETRSTCDTDHSRNSWAFESPSLAFGTPPVLVLDSLRASPMGVPFESEARCGDLGGRKDSWTSELPDCSLPQDPHGASSLGVQPDSEPISGDGEQKEICWVPASPVWGSSPLPNSMSKSHMSEPIGDKHDYKPEGETVKHTENCRTTELPATTPRFSALLPDPHIDLEFVRRNMQHLRGIPQYPNPLAVDPLQPIPWPPTQVQALTIESNQPGLPKEGLLTGANAETPSSQGEAIPKIPTYSGIQAWHWSKELELRLEKLQQIPASRSLSQSFSSSLTLSSTTQATRKLSSCPPQQTHPPSLWPHSSSCHPPKAQSTVTQPVQVPYCYHYHFSFQPQTQTSGRAEQGSWKEQRKKAKTIYQISPQESCVHMEAADNCLGQEEPSNPAVPASGKRQDKASALSSAKTRASPRKPKEGDYGEADASLWSSTVTGESHPAQARRLTENPVSRLSRRPQHSDQCSPHTAFSPQPHSKYVSSQGQRGARLGTPDILAPRHCKPCPWARKHLSSSPSAPLTSSLQRILAKFLGIHGPMPTKSVSRGNQTSWGTGRQRKS